MAENDEKELNEQHESTQQEHQNNEEASKDTEATETQEQEVTLEQKYAELNDKYLRLYSDFDNFRKRTMKEKADLISNASAGVLKELLPVLDDFERAIASNENTEDIQGLKEGFHLIYNKFKNTLTSKGVKPMDAKGQSFDLDLHEAITNIPAQDDSQKGKVVDEVEKGYFLNEKVLRYAKVVVGQ